MLANKNNKRFTARNGLTVTRVNSSTVSVLHPFEGASGILYPLPEPSRRGTRDDAAAWRALAAQMSTEGSRARMEAIAEFVEHVETFQQMLVAA